MKKSESSLELETSIAAFCDACGGAPDAHRYPGRLQGHLHALLSAIHAAEDAHVPRSRIVGMLVPAREIVRCSPLLARQQAWPRGYQGDFETVEALMAQKNGSPPESAVYWLEDFALSSTNAQQHSNRCAAQAAEILEQALLGYQKGRPRRVLILSCGGCPELVKIQKLLVSAPMELVLNDIDEDAIAHAEARLKLLSDKITVLHGNILLQIKELSRQRPFDLILSGSLYDYLTDAQAANLTQVCFQRLLSDDGVFVCTNSAPGNPFRIWQEYMVNWFVNQRNEAAIDALLDAQGIAPEHVLHVRDSTRMSVVTKIMKNPDQTLEQVIF